MEEMFMNEEKKCPLCGTEINKYAGDPSKWPVYLWDRVPGSGKGVDYCMGCANLAIKIFADIRESLHL